MNNFTAKSDAALVFLANNAAFKLGQTPGYHVPTAVTTALADAGTGFQSSIGAAMAAQDAAKGATTAKARSRATTLAALNAVANIIYTNGTPDEMIQNLGFSPRAGGSRPVAPVAVVTLSADAASDGTVALAWDKNGNRASAIYQVERSLDNGATWTIVASTSAAKARLSGYTPGMAAWFRVTTTNSVGTSLPSGTVGVYVGEEAEAVELRLAA